MGTENLTRANPDLEKFLGWVESLNPGFSRMKEEDGAIETYEAEREEDETEVAKIRKMDLEQFEAHLEHLNKERRWVIPLAGAVVGSTLGISRPKNTDSIILRLGEIDNSSCSALLPGDATKHTTDYVINSSKSKEDLKTTVLLSSHHGAEQEYSNHPSWIEATSPQTVIISAGHQQGIGHPRCTTIKRYLNIATMLEKGADHDLTCYIPSFVSTKKKEFLTDPEGYPIPDLKGDEAIYNTFDEGTITAHFYGQKFILTSSRKDKDRDNMPVTLLKGSCSR